MNHDVILEVRGITKFFPPNILANYKVDLTLRRGEIHALLGENGAGKSTLARIIYGECKPDEGEILVEGRRVKLRGPRDAIRLGIGMVHQHFRLVESMTVAENVALVAAKRLILPVREVRDRLREFARKYELDVDPDAYIWQLSVGERQRVEILKALYAGARILILDEPTTALSPLERRRLFTALKRLKDDGYSVLLITHRLEEALQSDRITVMRRGRVVATIRPEEVSREELARMMVGRVVRTGNYVKRPSSRRSAPLLEVEDLWVMSDKGVYAVRGVCLKVWEGEILGLVGEAGNGQRELVEAITGLRRVEKGRVIIAGEDVTNAGARRIAELGVAHIPEDRLRYGLAPGLSLIDNYLLRKYYKSEYRRGPFIDYGKAEEELMRAVNEYRIVTPSLRVPALLLSGGNMQKLILARELSEAHRLIIASHPTYGLDVATAEFVRRFLVRERNRGSGILLVSEDLEEAMALSDRVAIINRGRIVAVFKPGELSIEEVGVLMASEGVGARHGEVVEHAG